jgi:hypothetical protein
VDGRPVHHAAVPHAAARRGLYLVRTDTWYLERAVWLIAGVDVLISSALAYGIHPYWALSISLVGMSAVTVAVTGFCPVGNLVSLGGLKPLLRAHAGGRKATRLYVMQTDRWFLERFIYLFVGINLSLSSVLVIVHSPSWLLFTGFVGTACVVFSLTGFCIMAHLLYRLGAEPRLQR